MGEDRRAALRQQVAGLEAYARLKLDARDFHGLADAEMDIREVVAQLSELERVERAWPPPDPPAGDVMICCRRCRWCSAGMCCGTCRCSSGCAGWCVADD
jgi:hypothetical protein